MSFGLPRNRVTIQHFLRCRGKKGIVFNFSFVHLKFMSSSEIWA